MKSKKSLIFMAAVLLVGFFTVGVLAQAQNGTIDKETTEQLQLCRTGEYISINYLGAGKYQVSRIRYEPQEAVVVKTKIYPAASIGLKDFLSENEKLEVVYDRDVDNDKTVMLTSVFHIYRD